MVFTEKSPKIGHKSNKSCEIATNLSYDFVILAYE